RVLYLRVSSLFASLDEGVIASPPQFSRGPRWDGVLPLLHTHSSGSSAKPHEDASTCGRPDLTSASAKRLSAGGSREPKAPRLARSAGGLQRSVGCRDKRSELSLRR